LDPKINSECAVEFDQLWIRNLVALPRRVESFELRGIGVVEPKLLVQ
jgi:hypothetical protein